MFHSNYAFFHDRIATRFADDAVEFSLSSAWTKGVYNKRRIGVGICGVADFLTKMKLAYAESAARSAVEDAYAIVNIAGNEVGINILR